MTKHIPFNTFDEFFEFFDLPKSCSIRLTSDEIAHFEFHPYKNDIVVIRGWIEEFDHNEVQVSFKYREFDLGRTIWNLETARKYISKIDYYYEDYDEENS